MNKRRFVKVALLRAKDCEVGDVVSGDADKQTGWIVVAKKSTLFTGLINLSDKDDSETVTAEPFDLVAVQFVSETEVPAQPGIEPEYISSVAADTKEEAQEDGAEVAAASPEGESKEAEAAKGPAPGSIGARRAAAAAAAVAATRE